MCPSLASFRKIASSFGKILVSCCIFCVSPAYPWWETGHRTVARIAAAHLTSAARTRIARILSVSDTADAVADALSIASTWADETKAETKTGAWHYIDLALQDKKSDIPARCKDNNCVTARIRIFAAQLSSHTPNAPASQLDALRYLVHFVGDIHQPLHAVSDADLGGNCEQIDPPIDTAKNIHAIWDATIVNALGKSDRDLASDLERNLQSFNERLRNDLALGTQDDWAWESHKLAIKDIYERLHIPIEPVIFPANCQEAPAGVNQILHLPSSYIEDMKPVVREQLTKAGLRLARVLNEAL
jgi:S1/P1 Nuclease